MTPQRQQQLRLQAEAAAGILESARKKAQAEKTRRRRKPDAKSGRPEEPASAEPAKAEEPERPI